MLHTKKMPPKSDKKKKVVHPSGSSPDRGYPPPLTPEQQAWDNYGNR